jgi:hypothetical protein
MRGVTFRRLVFPTAPCRPRFVSYSYRTGRGVSPAVPCSAAVISAARYSRMSYFVSHSLAGGGVDDGRTAPPSPAPRGRVCPVGRDMLLLSISFSGRRVWRRTQVIRPFILFLVWRKANADIDIGLVTAHDRAFSRTRVRTVFSRRLPLFARRAHARAHAS